MELLITTYSIAALPALVLHAFPSPSPPSALLWNNTTRPSIINRLWVLFQIQQRLSGCSGKALGYTGDEGPAGEVIRDRVVIRYLAA
ncbi:hypothetical protein DTO271D3_1470 [Paecilomyces variotii]|nr:hypothetical protein DTO169C6_106 [Paecilomyces variotii]KAJ9318213.1 hypothetical protein DTO271D3_1470 [Paecilomyces variotii]